MCTFHLGYLWVMWVQVRVNVSKPTDPQPGRSVGGGKTRPDDPASLTPTNRSWAHDKVNPESFIIKARFSDEMVGMRVNVHRLLLSTNRGGVSNARLMPRSHTTWADTKF
jgi:hypothetical protein